MAVKVMALPVCAAVFKRASERGVFRDTVALEEHEISIAIARQVQLRVGNCLA
jgi:hypothetical protein